MWHRTLLAFLGAFWLTMNFLLWRAEYEGDHPLSSEVPVRLVWEKILTAPDASSLEIYRHHQRLGFGRWVPRISQNTNGPDGGSRPVPEGMVRRVSAYTLEAEGSMAWPGAGGRIRFNAKAAFGANREWENISMRLANDRNAWEFKSSAKSPMLQVHFSSPDVDWSRNIRLNGLRDPADIAREWGGSAAELLLQSFVPDLHALTRQAKQIHWTARSDWFRAGRHGMRVYQLRARLWDHESVVVTVSLVGEIIQVSLPGRWELVNEAFNQG